MPSRRSCLRPHPSTPPPPRRYKEVQPDSFGLAVEDILGLQDKELNQIVGLKKLAPYRWARGGATGRWG